MFRLTRKVLESLRFQFGTLNPAGYRFGVILSLSKNLFRISSVMISRGTVVSIV